MAKRTKRRATAAGPMADAAQDADPIVVTTFRLRRSQLDQLQELAKEHAREVGIKKPDASLLLRQRIIPEWMERCRKG